MLALVKLIPYVIMIIFYIYLVVGMIYYLVPTVFNFISAFFILILRLTEQSLIPITSIFNARDYVSPVGDLELKQACLKSLSTMDQPSLLWLVGFVDGEGNFSIAFDPRGYVRFIFKITLHIDDKLVLVKIKDLLKVGNIVDTATTASYNVYSLTDICRVILPLFIIYPLRTSKWFDFKDLWSGILHLIGRETLIAVILERTKAPKCKPSLLLLSILQSIKAGMNLNRKDFNPKDIPWTPMNDYWLLGFVEAEGTFGIKGLSPYFQVARLNISYILRYVKNSFVLTQITEFLQSKTRSIPLIPFFINANFPITNQDQYVNADLVDVSISSTLNKATNVISLSIVSMDSLFYVILPLFQKLEFHSRKSVDFYYWTTALALAGLGYLIAHPAIRTYFVSIMKYINKNRYSTNISPKLIPQLTKEVKDLLTNSPFDLSTFSSHATLSRNFGLSSQTTKYIYIKNVNTGELIPGSPFSSYADANKALGLHPSGRTPYRYINTGKAYKNTYIFYSTDVEIN